MLIKNPTFKTIKSVFSKTFVAFVLLGASAAQATTLLTVDVLNVEELFYNDFQKPEFEISGGNGGNFLSAELNSCSNSPCENGSLSTMNFSTALLSGLTYDNLYLSFVEVRTGFGPLQEVLST